MNKDYEVIEVKATSGANSMDEFSSNSFKVSFSNSSSIISNIKDKIEGDISVMDKLSVIKKLKL